MDRVSIFSRHKSKSITDTVKLESLSIASQVVVKLAIVLVECDVVTTRQTQMGQLRTVVGRQKVWRFVPYFVFSVKDCCHTSGLYRYSHRKDGQQS